MGSTHGRAASHYLHVLTRRIDRGMRGSPETGSKPATKIGMQVVDTCSLNHHLSYLAS